MKECKDVSQLTSQEGSQTGTNGVSVGEMKGADHL